MSKPAHKQDDPAKAPGQVVNDIKLADYYNRKRQLYEQLEKKPKMTFQEWWKQDSSHIDMYKTAQAAWKAGQENI
jgi:hypothetical protein